MARRLATLLALSAALLLTAALLPGSVANANHPATPRPLLECADVSGDGPVAASDIGMIVARYGQNSPDGRAVPGGYQALYDLAPQASQTGASISAGDIVAVVGDFGQSCLAGPDTQIAQATRAIMDPTFSSVLCDPNYLTTQNPVMTNCNGSQQFLTENPSFLASRGYVSGSTVDVPGQGVHYVNLQPPSNGGQWDGVFNPARPEGLVYDSGKLVAQLYNVVGDPNSGGVGWGPEPPPPDQNQIDAFCTPQFPNTTACSWTGPYDGWHVHTNLCMTWLGTSHAAFSIQPDALACEAHQNSQPWGGTWQWQARIGWMGHMWNHWLNPNINVADVNGNGRFDDCFPDTQHWSAFNCPQ